MGTLARRTIDESFSVYLNVRTEHGWGVPVNVAPMVLIHQVYLSAICVSLAALPLSLIAHFPVPALLALEGIRRDDGPFLAVFELHVQNIKWKRFLMGAQRNRRGWGMKRHGWSNWLSFPTHRHLPLNLLFSFRAKKINSEPNELPNLSISLPTMFFIL